MVTLMFQCPSISFIVTMSTPLRVSREAIVCRNMCHDSRSHYRGSLMLHCEYLHSAGELRIALEFNH